MRYINNVTLFGNLGQDPEIRAMQNGNEVCNISLATSKSWKDDRGEWQSITEWHKVSVFGQYNVDAVKNLKKGDSVLIYDAELKTSEWKTNTGETRKTIGIHANKGSKIVGMPKNEIAKNDNNIIVEDEIPF